MKTEYKNWNPIQMDQYIQLPSTKAPWILSQKKINNRHIPIVTSDLSLRDRWGFVKMRLGLGRMQYTVPPGLYGIGEPDQHTPVFVTANYKMTFDLLRRDLKQLNGWILVLDTKGINVWCAAGKGSFGTEELVRRVKATQLAQIIYHHELIVPQLGAVGVAAHEVQKRIGFKVLYGPVYSRNIQAYIKNSKKVSPEMRRIRFSLRDRLVVTPLELMPALKYFPFFVLFFLLKTWLYHEPITNGLLDGLGLLGAIFTGSILVPVLLPFIPGRAFSVKGALSGFIFALIWSQATAQSLLNTVTQILIYTSVTSYLSLNFTGSSTFTNMSGVYKEMRLALPWLIPFVLLGLILTWF